MTKVKLTEAEKRVGVLIAKARYKSNRKANIKRAKLPQDSELDPDIEGAMSELALCKHLGVYPEGVMEVGTRSVSKGTDDGDIVFEGVSIDAKSTQHQTGRLICMKKNDAVDLYVLLVGRRGEYDIKGCMYAKDLCVEDRYGHHGVFRKACYKAEQNELMNLEDVFPSIASQAG